ncbi:MAG: regulatory iron-sulfur-containing complex subunit RicT [Cyclobacteriaceae bacterium]|nr:regulatory iron-sulfur-containing complex subunit RicT [Cyclobacteriaceae bacterium]
MSCASCFQNGVAAGCKNNGGCATGGCNKMNVFDWLSDMELSVADSFDVVEVRFKNGRKDFFRNSERISLVTGDPVVVNRPNGHHMGFVSMQGELVRLQVQKKKFNLEEAGKIYRKAHRKDLERYEEVRNREKGTLSKARLIIQDLRLNMKLTDVEYQADNTKAIFYYTADERVDFRELIKLLASEFRIRVEMRQVSMRQEAGYLGGIGSCGRELCCSTWLSDFKNVTTGAARYQNLSLNPSKLSGQCGRLKCCLNYELDTYKEVLADIPDVNEPLLTMKGKAILQKTDIFRKIMWFGYQDENNWHPISIERVSHILEMNEKGEKPASLMEDAEKEHLDTVTLNSDLARMDKKFSKKSKGRKNKNRKKFRNNKNKPKNN